MSNMDTGTAYGRPAGRRAASPRSPDTVPYHVVPGNYFDGVPAEA